MAKNWIAPIEIYRTPEQHRKAIQKPHANPVGKKKARKRAWKWREIPGFTNYAEYLKSEAWQDVRTRWMKSKLFKGDKCHAQGCDQVYFLSLHHRTYKRIGAENLTDLILVCNKCHQKIHDLEKSGIKLQDATKRIVGY